SARAGAGRYRPCWHRAMPRRLAIRTAIASRLIGVRIPEHPPTHSDDMRPPVPGYSPTCDALP
ncbi:hypothetical protein, partial [Pseudorhodobacter sp.]|uniref:hypothetical protein n=1 Tax=Pseudorhodobacter sp. TaxID=1934400 RepID=UPI00264A2078